MILLINPEKSLIISRVKSDPVPPVVETFVYVPFGSTRVGVPEISTFPT